MSSSTVTIILLNMKLTKLNFRLFYFMILYLLGLSYCLELISQFGSGFCLPDPALQTIQYTGPKMCITACLEDRDCVSVNHHRDSLSCQLLTWDSSTLSEFVLRDYCTHYTASALNLNTSGRCGDTDCNEHHTCITILSNEKYCIRTACSDPVVPHGIFANGSNTVSGVREATCSTYYEFNGGASMDVTTCGAGGHWDKALMCQLKECPEPSAPQYGTVLSGNSSIGSSREIECTTGYAKLGAESGIICQHDQTWTTWTGTCSTCSNPSAISSAYIGSGTVTMGSQRTYYCNTGYQSNGYSATITCQSDATWTSTSFGCNLKDCGSPPSVSLAAASYSATTYGASVTYTCNYGYIGNGGSLSIFCQSSAVWSAVQFSCIRPSTATFDFEGFDTYSMEDYGAAYSWTRQSGATPSADTGPRSAYFNSYYMYLETSRPVAAGGVAKMATDIYFSDDVNCVDFKYHMYGVHMGSLSVLYVLEGTSSEYQIWYTSGNKGNAWNSGRANIYLSQNFKLIFQATKGGSSSSDWGGDIAVDLIQVKTSC